MLQKVKEKKRKKKKALKFFIDQKHPCIDNTENKHIQLKTIWHMFKTSSTRNVAKTRRQRSQTTEIFKSHAAAQTWNTLGTPES